MIPYKAFRFAAKFYETCLGRNARYVCIWVLSLLNKLELLQSTCYNWTCDVANSDPTVIRTGSETWIYGYEMKATHQRSEWKKKTVEIEKTMRNRSFQLIWGHITKMLENCRNTFFFYYIFNCEPSILTYKAIVAKAT